jgi:4,5-dihydroxyphthalate decarboxylase
VIARTERLWRDLPVENGAWNSVLKCIRRWVKNGHLNVYSTAYPKKILTLNTSLLMVPSSRFTALEWAQNGTLSQAILSLTQSNSIRNLKENKVMTIDRRKLLRAGVISAASSTLSVSALVETAGSARAATGGSVGRDLNMAGYPSEHIKGLMNGKVQVKDINVQFRAGAIGDLNTEVFSNSGTLDFSEIGLTPYILAFANDNFRAHSLIPVFPLRIFRHRSIFVHADRGINKPADLKGKRIGTPGYSSTSLTAIRGLLQDEYDVRPEDIEWVVSQKDSSAKDSGKASKQENVFPDGLNVRSGPEGKDESDLLVDGDVDALFHAAEPRAFIEGHAKVKRLFADSRKTEQEYYAKTGIFPIMHAVALRNDLIEQHPWLPEAVFDAYVEAKRMTFAEMRGKWYLRTMPWFAQELEATKDLMGENFFPYGIKPNRKALETMFRYADEQGLASRQLKIEDVFVPSTLDLIDG